MASETPPSGPPSSIEEGPPFFRNWSGAYLFVIVNLAVVIAIFAWLSWVYR
jgi:hypothetical protein